MIERLGRSVLLAVLLGASAFASQNAATAVRAARPPVIDGLIQPEEWAGAARLENFVQFEPQRGKPATQPTVGYFLYDDTHVYVAVYAYDSEPGQITARHTVRDGQIRVSSSSMTLPDDAIIIFLDTFHDRHTCYFFAANPLGIQTDGTVQDNGRVYDVTWDTAWEVAARKAADGWTAEFAIPLRAMLFRAGQNRTWGFNILRARRATLETSVWNGPLEAVFRVSQYGEIQGLDLKGGGARTFQLIPYALGSYQQGRSLKGDLGMDVRYIFRPETTVNVTANPDFATIEGDEEFVNLTRFEAQLTEKRPFFLETNRRFRQRIQTFYSRRIGDIDVGGQLQSKSGPWDVTLIAARSRMPVTPAPGQAGTQGAAYAVGRVERQFLKSSVLGMMFTNRSFAGENRGAMSLDTAAYFTRRFGFTGQVVRAHGPYKKGIWGWFARPSYDSSTGHAHFRFTHLGERFGDNANATAYIRDDDRREMDSDLAKTFWFEKGAVQRIYLESKNSLYLSQRNVVRGYHTAGEVNLDFRNRWSASAELLNEYRLFEKGYHNRQAEFQVGYNTREYQSWNVGYETGRSFDSDYDAVNGYLRRKLAANTTAEYQLSRVWLTPDPSLQATLINVFRLRHNFTRDLFLRVFYQTNSVIDRRNLEAVFVWRYKPPFGLVQFAFQRGRAAFGERSEQGNTYFIKLAYVL